MKHLVIIGAVFPEPNSTAAGRRMIQLIELFQERNWRVSFLSAATNNEYSFELSNINVASYAIQLNNNSFDELITALSPDAVLFDRFLTEEQYGWRVAECVPKAITILDTEDLHFLRYSRAEQYKKNTTWCENHLFETTVFQREMASIHRCDLTIIISDYEMKLLTDTFRIASSQLIYLPLFADIAYPQLPFEERTHFVSIGNFLHEPNWHTVLLLKKYWNAIRKELPEAQLHIYGAYPSEKVYQLHSEKDGFIIRGRADSVEEIFQRYRVLLAPIPFGAGIKGKLLEAMQYGLPSVTTNIGAEGMRIDNEWNGDIRDDEDEFVSSSIYLYRNKKYWDNCQYIGNQIIKGKFWKSLYAEKFHQIIEQTFFTLSEHRKKHYLGMIFRYHTLQSTRFMSKWIEEKNKKL